MPTLSQNYMQMHHLKTKKVTWDWWFHQYHIWREVQVSLLSLWRNSSSFSRVANRSSDELWNRPHRFNHTLTSGKRVFLKHTLEGPSLVSIIYARQCQCLFARHCESESVSYTVVAHQAPLHEVSQARILEWVAIPLFRGYSWPRNQNWVSCTAGRFFTNWATRE